MSINLRRGLNLAFYYGGVAPGCVGIRVTFVVGQQANVVGVGLHLEAPVPILELPIKDDYRPS
jgi:hypothetical protein